MLQECFQRIGDEHGETLVPYKFYKAHGWNENYDCDLKKYNEWLSQCHKAVKESIKAANWFADVVRRDVNPMFFATEGKFIIGDGSLEIPEFTDNEKERLPQSIVLDDLTV